jgi:hypothetical protein
MCTPVAVGLVGAPDEARDLLRGREGDVRGQEEDVDRLVSGARVAAAGRSPGQQPSIGLPAVLEEVALLGHHVQRLAQRRAQLLAREDGLQPVRVPDHPDLAHLGHALQHAYHVLDERTVGDLEVDLALPRHGLRGVEVAGGDDRGDLHGI